MANTTLDEIIARFRAVLEAAPFAYVQARDQFSHDRQPNTVLDNAYWIADDGLSSSRPVTNYQVARLDRLTVYLAKKLNFAPATTLEDLQHELLGVERAVKGDGPNNSYYAELVGRRVTRPPDRDIAIGSVTMLVDYDINEYATADASGAFANAFSAEFN